MKKTTDKKCSKCKKLQGSNWWYCDYCWDYIGSKDNVKKQEAQEAQEKIRKNKTRKKQ